MEGTAPLDTVVTDPQDLGAIVGDTMLGSRLLAEHLAVTGQNYSGFASLIGAHRTQIQRACDGERKPSLYLAILIEEGSQGAVPDWTWCMDEPPRCRRPNRALVLQE